MPLIATPSPAASLPDDLGERLDAGIRSGLLRKVHAVLVSHAGRLVLERYYTGHDEAWGKPLGFVTFGPDTLHDLRSVTKSIVGLLYGIALDRGLVPPPSARLLAQFPEYPDLAADPQRQRMTIENALTMTLGMQWDENRPYTDPENSEIQMENAPDRYRFILDRPVIETPGHHWIYSGGAVALIGYLIARGAGLPLQAFARTALFAPLGIFAFEWAAGHDGVASAASGLRLRAPDLLRIGEMVLAGGLWNGTRVVPEDWLAASFTPAVGTGQGVNYGRLWYSGESYMPAFGDRRRWLAGFGNGGQRIYLMPDAGIAAAMFLGDYNAPDHWIAPNRIWQEIVLANFRNDG